MMELVFATHNKNKVIEVQNKLPPFIKLLSLSDIHFNDDIEETASTIEGNALLKAQTIYNVTKKNCFADDSGLLVNSLNGEPGVYSARYAGNQKNDGNNMDKLLLNLKSHTDRTAYFKTVLALIIDGEHFLFEGIINGEITHQKNGNFGFGYDPIFKPNGYCKTFAEMNLDEKSAISHRGLALKKMADFIKLP